MLVHRDKEISINVSIYTLSLLRFKGGQDTVAMFLLRNDQETVIIVNTSESSCSNSGIILGLRKV